MDKETALKNATYNEKLMALGLLLSYERSYWESGAVGVAFDIATDLKLKPFIDSIRQYWKIGETDGRYFRMSHKEGGYEKMKELHGKNWDEIIDFENQSDGYMNLLKYAESEMEFDDKKLIEYYSK